MSTEGGPFEHPPGRVLGAAALAFAVVTAAVLGTQSTLSVLATGFGVVGLTVGLARDDRRAAGIGVVSLLGGVLAGGGAGAPPALVLPATAAGLLSWEFAAGSFDVRNVVEDGTVERSEVVHVVTATSAGALLTGFTYVVYRTLSVGVSILGVTLLLVAAVALAVALRE